MPFPAYGALGHTFVVSRSLQILLLLVTIGISGHCISVFTHEGFQAPGRLIGYLIISCLGIVYSAFSTILYFDSALPMLLAAICDGCFFFAYIAVSILFGENIAKLTCQATDLHVPVSGGRDIIIPSALAVGKTTSVPPGARMMKWKRAQDYEYATPTDSLGEINFGDWVRSSQRGCQMMKGAWALSTVLVVVFFLSMASLMGLWWKLRKQIRAERKSRESKIEDNIQWST